jgi:hypothetical protein
MECVLQYPRTLLSVFFSFSIQGRISFSGGRAELVLKYSTLEGRVSWVTPTTPRGTYSDQSNYIEDSVQLSGLGSGPRILASWVQVSLSLPYSAALLLTHASRYFAPRITLTATQFHHDVQECICAVLRVQVCMPSCMEVTQHQTSTSACSTCTQACHCISSS